MHLSVILASTLSPGVGGERRDLDFVHNTSQYIHCLAQGKVGSGFDISSAVYGSQIYKRFDESVLRRPMDETVGMKPDEVRRTVCGTLARQILMDRHLECQLSSILRDNASWTCEARSIRLPPKVVLLLADVDAGSDTPSLVGRVLSWRRSSQVEGPYSTMCRQRAEEVTADFDRVIQQRTRCGQACISITAKSLPCFRNWTAWLKAIPKITSLA